MLIVCIMYVASSFGKIWQQICWFSQKKNVIQKGSSQNKYRIPKDLFLCTCIKCFDLVHVYWYQFGFGISKMVGPKKQVFWPRINILKELKKKFKDTRDTEWNDAMTIKRLILHDLMEMMTTIARLYNNVSSVVEF